MKKLLALFALYIVCSADKGLTRQFYRNVNHVFYGDGCLVWQADQVDGQVYTCSRNDECVVREGTVPPAGTPSDDYLQQESTDTVKQ